MASNPSSLPRLEILFKPGGQRALEKIIRDIIGPPYGWTGQRWDRRQMKAARG